MRLHYATEDSYSYCIKLYGITYDPTKKTYMTVNQYCNSGDLRSFLKSKSKTLVLSFVSPFGNYAYFEICFFVRADFACFCIGSRSFHCCARPRKPLDWASLLR